MAYSVFSNYQGQYNTDAQLRSWGGTISTNLTAIGLTKTADTGQVDWATVARPTSSNSIIGYEIRTFTPSAGAAIYVKFDFYTGSQTNGYNWKIGTTVGTGSDGAGAITGVQIAQTFTHNQGVQNPTTVTGPSFFASWDGGFGLAFNTNINASIGLYYFRELIVVDRTRNASNAVVDNGLWFTCTSDMDTNIPLANSQYYSNELGVAVTPTYGSTYYRMNYSGALGTSVSNGKRPITIGKHLTPTPCYHTGVVLGYGDDMPYGLEFDADILGETNVHYMSIGHVGGVGFRYPLQHAQKPKFSFAFRWEE